VVIIMSVYKENIVNVVVFLTKKPFFFFFFFFSIKIVPILMLMSFSIFISLFGNHAHY
jgi:hypothetical protein